MKRQANFIKQLLMYSTVIGFSFACADDGKKKDAGAPAAAATGDANQNSGSGDGASAQPAKPEKPKYRIGDEIVKVVESKSWRNADSNEPGDFQTKMQHTLQLIHIYESNSNCKYRFGERKVNLNSPNQPIDAIEFDWDCKEEGLTCKSETNCTSSEIEAADVGTFLQAKGEKKICTTVTCGASNNTQKIVKVESFTYKHDDSIYQDNIVKEIVTTCTMTLAPMQSPSGVDACLYIPGGSATQKSRVQTVVTSQKEGTGGVEPNAKRSSYAVFSTATGPTSKEKKGYSSAVCDVTRSYVDVLLTNSFCTSNGTMSETLYLRRLNITPAAQNTSTTVMPYMKFSLLNELSSTVQMCPANYSKDYYLDANSQCSVTLTVNEADKKLMGKGSCPQVFFVTTPGPTSSSPRIRHEVKVTDFEFLCDTPSLDFYRFR